MVPLLAAWLVCQTTLSVVFGYRDYFPPNFRADFLIGRESYFFGSYEWTFYAHILSGPFCLLSGLTLMVEWVRARYPRVHRLLGRAHVLAVLLVMTPSGLWMAGYSATGRIAGAGFATLAVLTALCAVLGWRTAMRRDFTRHRVWMQRTFALLTSAVVLRLIGGLSEVSGWRGAYPYAAWLSWLLPLTGLEAVRRLQCSTVLPTVNCRFFTAEDRRATDPRRRRRSASPGPPLATPRQRSPWPARRGMPPE